MSSCHSNGECRDNIAYLREALVALHVHLDILVGSHNGWRVDGWCVVISGSKSPMVFVCCSTSSAKDEPTDSSFIIWSLRHPTACDNVELGVRMVSVNQRWIHE